MRKNIIAGNWKMNLNRVQAITLVENVLNNLPLELKADVVFAPSSVHLNKVVEICTNINNLFVSSQDCSSSQNGAFTGEISAEMIASYGVQYVIIGHSERRVNFNETNALLKLKVEQALVNNLQVIFCCGESLKQRQNGVYFEWIKSQISDSLFHLSAFQFTKVVIAYEPIWAIGTGVTATSDQAQEVHRFIRDIIKEKYGEEVSLNTSILYGGSCNPTNAIDLFAQKDIDGGLIGGASLNSDDFSAIINSF